MNVRPILAALWIAALATPAAAAERAWLHGLETGSDGVRSVTVDLSDVDPATTDGAATLRDRVKHAAVVVCAGPLPDDVFYGNQSRARAACRRDTVRSVETRLAELDSRAGSGERVVVTLTVRGPSAAS